MAKKRTQDAPSLPSQRTDVILHNVRCFTGAREHIIPIHPFTIIVGENSSGKTTLLAMLSALSQADRFPMRPQFNQAPFDLGNYATIASHLDSGKRASSFVIGYRIQSDGFVRTLRATFSEKLGQPALHSVEAQTQHGSFTIKLTDEEMILDVFGAKSHRGQREHHRIIGRHPEGDFAAHVPSFSALNQDLVQAALMSAQENDKEGLRLYKRIADMFTASALPSARSLAPVRTRPRRTYDELNDEFSPEGDHIPVLLSRILARSKGKEREALLATISAFGKESGLFQSLSVRRLGRHVGDPFQIHVSLAGKLDSNIPDVGYGVSQALPIVVESILTASQRRLLLQQPEVHLHPRAQAALGTFLASLVAQGEKSFVVETHSDYLIDRVRQEVANGKIAAEDVLILFFDRRGLRTTVSPIRIDDQGNVLDAPSSYRRFFLEEEERLLKRGRL